MESIKGTLEITGFVDIFLMNLENTSYEDFPFEFSKHYLRGLVFVIVP